MYAQPYIFVKRNKRTTGFSQSCRGKNYDILCQRAFSFVAGRLQQSIASAAALQCDVTATAIVFCPFRFFFLIVRHFPFTTDTYRCNFSAVTVRDCV